MQVNLSKRSLVKGTKAPIEVTSPLIQNYSQLQVEIYNIGVRNPRSCLGFGTAPQLVQNDTYTVDLNSSTLKIGVYEVRLIILHTPKESSMGDRVDFVAGKDFQRTIFEVISVAQLPRDAVTIAEEALENEKAKEREFLSPLDIRKTPGSSDSSFIVFVFVRGLLIGSRVRFDRHELLPLGRGLDSRDNLDCVNEFLQTTSTGPIADENTHICGKPRSIQRLSE